MISIKNFSKQYKKKIIFDQVLCDFKNDRISFLMGKNGSGKTTLIKCLMGMETGIGEFLFDGQEINAEIRKDILILWDDCPFYTNLSGLQNLILFDNGQHKRTEICQTAEEFLSNEILKSRLKNYSYGQKKKLGLALIQILRPKILIMDEITNGLDYSTLKLLNKKLIEWKKDNIVILTGHHLEYYNNVIDDLFILSDNKINEYSGDFKSSGLSLEEIYEKQIY